MIRKILFFCLLIGFAISAKAQLSDLHYLPPLKQGQNNAGISQQAIYLSTPEPTTFTVNAYRGTNNTPVATFTISNLNPAVYTLPNGDNNITLVDNANTGIVLNNSGLRFESPSGNKFYANYRGSSSYQSASLTSKGRVAIGTRFKWGGVPNLGEHPSKSNTLGIMATEDNTTIDVFGYDPDCEFRLGNNVGGITANTYQITLDANESFVFEAYIGNNPIPANRAGWIGASIVSDKNIVISNGAMNYGRQANSFNRDAGIDQPVPENRIGKEYVFVRGNGNTNGATEFPLLIAIADNTQIFVNGSTTPIATINNGDYFEIPSSYYSSNTVGANMLVQTSKNVYAYQCLAGSSAVFTQGLNFVAPVNCLLPDVMDNIPDIRNVAGTIVTGGLTIIAAVNTPDANISVKDSNGAVALPASNPVAGSIDWKTFYIPNLNGNVSVKSTGPMAIGFFGFNGARGIAGYFSGFDTVPEVNLEIRGGSGCFVGSTIFEATENFDAYQWYHDGVLVPGANSPNYDPSIAGDYFIRGTKGPCTYDSQAISALYCDPDVILNKTVDKPEINEGETATFTIRAKNLGVGPVTNLQITDNIPAGLTLVSAFTITGNWSGNIWNIGTLDGGDSAILELEVRADEIDTLPLLTLTNTATNTQDQVDTNITTDNPSARITIHNDYDNDGVNDITDLDDDNDGVYDEQECSNLTFNNTGGNAHNSSLISTENYMILDVFSLDNSFNIQINGTDLAGEIQFQKSKSGNFASFADGRGYGENGTGSIWLLNGSPGSPLIRVVVDESGQLGLYGSKTSNGPLEPMVLASPAATFAWNATGNNSITIGQEASGPTNMRGMLLTAGCDEDLDGIPSQLDLDSDGDGCSDANEFYKEATADGGDGGEYGTGVPMIDTNTGAVNAASYVKVFAPEILLGNTTEDLGGNDINGQALSLGQTFEYVLRFQNTGDDNATSYTIRDILPNTITLDNVDITNSPGTTHSYDINTNIINFSIPDNLVEVGDPKYSIRIKVTIASNCTDFVAACSSQLKNNAYSTYHGIINTSVFTDENGSNSITACPRTPEVAENSVLKDLANCNQARKVQLCGDDVILSAGQGFTTYNWVLDTNGNRQIDPTDTVMNDGDPDADPRTLVVTSIGTYIVEKTSNASSCPDLIEIMKVERFGTTQTNPIVDYFNQVNADANPDNDLLGEIVTCAIDGDILPKIFLCGTNDEATIQLGISDAKSIVWQKLDEGSCTSATENCANKNRTCGWNDVKTVDNYTVTDSGEYRIVINYQNGCFSRFYFNVYKNNLDIVSTKADILCTTPGNIRITNVGAGYGFQLINAKDDSIIIPFSANNGPNFDIAASGTYKVQVTQLNPADNTPIVGTCIFETKDIGILEKNFNVVLSKTPADCNQLGTISISALNALPNYSYELRLDDGSNGGQGSLVSSQPTLKDNKHTFSNVNPEDYIVITRTQDGCFDSQQVTVAKIPELTLNAVTSENITCNPGIVNLTPAGGLPTPNYEIAIWSKNGTQLYADESSVPAAEFQTTTSFLFGDIGNTNREGDYTFIVKDGNGCYAVSNSVRVDDLGTLSISAANSGIICADSSTATMTVSVTGGTTPYQYSLDGGVNYQKSNTFHNLSAGLYTITVMGASSTTGTSCVENFDYEIVQPFRLTASAAVVEDASCNPAGALVKILNANGGQTPFQYSFDGGTSYSGNNTRNLLAGDYQLAVKDALGCTFDMNLKVASSTIDPTFTSSIAYNCGGLGTVTISPSNTTDFNYSYSLNGTANTPADTNIFTGIANGTHTVTVGYSSSTPPDQSTLFFENFGAGPTTQIGEIGSGYCYEPQDRTTTNCNLGPAGILVNGEYAVTNFVTNPVPRWRSPNDHSAQTNGRFLAIDVSTLAGDKGILWARRNIEVLPNRDISIALWAYNLLRTTGSGNNPEILIELVDGTGTVISSIPTAEIPKNTNADDWHNREVTLNPGANTSIDIVLRSNLNSDYGNDLVLDDIQAYQVLEVCKKTEDITVVVKDNQAFSAKILSTKNPSCTTSSDGSIRFEVLNFDTTTGFQYSTDGTNWTTAMVSEVTTSATLTAGVYTVQVARLPDTSCIVDFQATLTAPDAIIASLSRTADHTCFNTGGTLQASATGGNPSYQYQLEDTSGNIIVAYQTNSNFINIADGDYLVRVQDQNNCSVLSATPITITPPQTVVFDLTPVDCYSGNNDGSILVNVTAGNGDYEFRINNNGAWGAWTAPTPSTATTHTFKGLSNGSYDIEVRDQLGCPMASNAQTVIINAQLVASVDAVDPSSCGDGSITVNATGGNGTLLYAIVPANTSPTGLYSTTNILTVTNAMATANPGGYDIYVQDNNGSPELCSFVQEDIILSPATPLSVTVVPKDPDCYNGLGSLEVTVVGGTAPYTYTLVDLSPADGIDYSRVNSNVSTTALTFNGIGVGDYEVNITDANSCTTTFSVATINNKVEITADIVPILPANCDDPANTAADFGFRFDNVVTPIGNIEYSDDRGTTWQLSNELRGNVSGTEVFPSIRVEVSPGVYCQKDFNRYIIPFPLDDLDITLSAIIVGCNDLQVTVEGSQGNSIPGYQYTYTDDPANFNTFAANPAVWTAPLPSGTSHRFQNIDPTTPQYPGVPLLIPGRTYVFYVKDGSGCIRQSNININEIPKIDLPIAITTDVKPSCSGAANGVITFDLNPSRFYPNMRWEIYEVGNPTPVEVSGGGATAASVAYNATITTTVPLSKGAYHINVVQVDGANADGCRGSSENTYVPELPPLNATAVTTRDISCNLPGLISINGISGGGGARYRYDVSGPAGFTTLTGTTDNPVEIPVNSPAGNYTVTLYDQYNCSLVLNTVPLSLAPNPTLTVTQDNCSSPITLTAVGNSAIGNLRYAIVPTGTPSPTSYQDNGGLFNNVSPGSYDVYVTDGNGCTNSQTAFVVYPVLSASALPTKLLDCTVSPDAEINVEIRDGSGNYEYSITNTAGAPPVAQTIVPANSFTYQAPLAGNYTVTIYDTNTPNILACNRTFVVNVPDRIKPVIDPAIVTTNITCIGNTDGTITISTTNSAAAPYDFEITAFDGTAVSINHTSTTGTSATFTGLAPTTTATGYIVTVTGNAATNGCSVNSDPIILAEPNAITFDLPTVVPFRCTSDNSTNNARISINTASITGGSGTFVNYEFIDVTNGKTLQNGTGSDYIYTNLSGGDVRVLIRDDNGCIGERTVPIPAFDALGTATITIDNAISCSTLTENISIDITGSLTNYTANPTNYEFRQLPTGIYQASNQFNNLAPGAYTFAVRNVTTGCEVTIGHSIANPNTFDVTVEKLNDVVCHGADGSIRLLMKDATYSGRFKWSIFNTNGTPADRSDDGAAIQTGDSPDFGPTNPINIPAGNYLIEVVQDAFPNCGQVRSFTITTPDAPLTLDTIELSNVGCSNDQGTAIIKPLGGLAPYNITLTNTTKGTIANANSVRTNLFQGLTDGQYTVTVIDALGCSKTFPAIFTLSIPDPISGIISAESLACEGNTDATIEINLNHRNVTPNYRFVLNRYNDITKSILLQSTAPQTTSAFKNQGAGFYTVAVLDDIGCSFESTIVEIVNPTETTGMLVTSAMLSCLANAELELTATGGTAPYMWSTDGVSFNAMNEINGANTHLFQNSSAGAYRYYVRDSNNCISTFSNEITISPIEDLTLKVDTSAATINCNGESTALIEASADGGLGNYQYGLFSDLGLANEIRPYQKSGTFANLPSGTYYINVQSEDCVLTSKEILIVEPEVVVVKPILTNVSCNGDSDGAIVLEATGGSGGYQFAISPNLNQFDDKNSFENLAVGNYTVIVQDSKGCFELIEFSITEPEILGMSLNSTPEICSGDSDGSITVTVTGGTAPYSTAINSASNKDFVEGRLNIQNLSGGDYLIFVKDANGCIVDGIVSVEFGANLNAMAEVIYECTGDTPNNRLNIVLVDKTVGADILYALDSTNSANFVLEPKFENLTPGKHYVTIVHANGCMNTLEFVVEAYKPLQLTLEQLGLNEITANAVGGKEGYTFYFNDQNNAGDHTFYIKKTGTYTVRVVDENDCESRAEIYMEFIDIKIPNFFTPDGDGKNDFWIPTNIEQFPDIFIKIYDRYGREVHQIKDTKEGWSGLYNNSGLPTGDYWYIIKLNGEDDDREFVGNLTLYR